MLFVELAVMGPISQEAVLTSELVGDLRAFDSSNSLSSHLPGSCCVTSYTADPRTMRGAHKETFRV